MGRFIVLGGVGVAGAMLMASASFAADLVYTPINPSFGGNPSNGSYLLSIAAAQKTATEFDNGSSSSSTGTGTGTGTDTSTSAASLFVSELQGRLLSALASSVTDAIFGPNPQTSGTVTFGDTTVVFDNTGTAINLTITDPTGVTVISVPQLVTSN